MIIVDGRVLNMGWQLMFTSAAATHVASQSSSLRLFGIVFGGGTGEPTDSVF